MHLPMQSARKKARTVTDRLALEGSTGGGLTFLAATIESVDSDD